MKQQRGLGKGLDALFTDNSIDMAQGANGTTTLRLSEIEPNRNQPRKAFDEEALSQLADSIRQHGVLQPLVVRPMPGLSSYQLVAGERRWRASRMAGLSDVPVIIREMDDTEVMEIALIENLQREDLNPIEEAEGYQILMDHYGLTQDEVSQRVGKSRPAIANALRLLNLPSQVCDMVKNGALSSGHARALLSLGSENELQMKTIAGEIIKKGLSVREVEKIVKQDGDRAKSKSLSQKTASVVSGEVERSLTELLGRRVSVIAGKNKGVIEIEYYGEDDLKELARRLAGEK